MDRNDSDWLEPARVVERAHFGESTSSQLVQQCAGIVTGGLRDAVSAMWDAATGSPGPERRVLSAVQEAAREFHATHATLTTGVSESLKRLDQGAPLVLFAHQPIAFAYDGVTAQYPLLAELAATRHGRPRAVAVHLLVDTDDATEPYFRTSRIPSPHMRNGARGTPLPVSVRHTTMRWAAPPSPDLTRELLSSCVASYRHLVAYAKSLGVRRAAGPFQEADRACSQALSAGDSLSGFNAAILSVYANCMCGYDTLFLPYSSLLRSLAAEAGELLDIEPLLRATYARSVPAWFEKPLADPPLYWLVCESCHRRFAPSGGRYRDSCPDCGVQSRRRPATLTDLVAVGAAVPRVVVDDVIFSRVLRPALAVSYASSAAHVLPSAGLIGALDRPRPHLLWRPRPIRSSVAELVALRMLDRSDSASGPRRALALSLLGRGSLVYSLLEAPASSAVDSWARHWAQAPNFGEPCSLLTPDYIDIAPALLSRLAQYAKELARAP